MNNKRLNLAIIDQVWQISAEACPVWCIHECGGARGASGGSCTCGNGMPCCSKYACECNLYSSFSLSCCSIFSFAISCSVRRRHVLPPEVLDEDPLPSCTWVESINLLNIVYLQSSKDVKCIWTKHLKVPWFPLEGGGGEYAILKFNKTCSGIRTVKTEQSGLANRTVQFC
jgi:hypothetical protein